MTVLARNVLTIALLLRLVVAPVAHAGFGVSPPLIKEDRLVKGISFERVIYLVQGNPDRDVPIELAVNSDISGWISFPQGMPITIPAGVQQYPLVVRIEVPQDAELGVYKGDIRITAVPDKADESGEVAIALGGLVKIDITVGEGVIYDFAVKQIKLLDIKEGQAPRARIDIVNSGNVPAGPDTVTFELFNKFGEIRLAYAENTSFKDIPVFSEGGDTLSFPMNIYLAPGEYWGHVKVYKNEELLSEQKTVFNVTKLTLFEKLLPWGIGALVLVILVVLGIVVRNKFFKRKIPIEEVPS